jgi:hypothetical protein
MKTNSMAAPLRFILDELTGESDLLTLDGGRYTGQQFYGVFCAWCQQTGDGSKMSQRAFSLELTRRLKFVNKSMRIDGEAVTKKGYELKRADIENAMRELLKDPLYDFKK